MEMNELLVSYLASGYPKKSYPDATILHSAKSRGDRSKYNIIFEYKWQGHTIKNHSLEIDSLHLLLFQNNIRYAY